MIGPGKYDNLCSFVRLSAAADGVILIVQGGKLGHGFSAQLPPELMATMPDVLRHVADKIEEDYKNGLVS